MLKNESYIFDESMLIFSKLTILFTDVKISSIKKSGVHLSKLSYLDRFSSKNEGDYYLGYSWKKCY